MKKSASFRIIADEATADRLAWLVFCAFFGYQQIFTTMEMGQSVSYLAMIASNGRGGLDLLVTGSVALQVVQDSLSPVFMVPVQNGKVESGH